MNIKFSRIVKYSRDTWRATFSSKMLANNVFTNKLLQESDIVAFIPRFKISRKVVIKEIPIDVPLTELKEVIEEENPGVNIINMFRLKQRNRATRVMEESELVCMEIKGEVFQEKISIWRAIIPVKPYVQSVRLCFKCGRIGHISKFCERPEACLMCGGDHRLSREEPCSRGKKCINCEGPHSTMDRSCPVLKKQMEIAKVMAYDNLPFIEARLLVEKNTGGKETSPIKLYLSSRCCRREETVCRNLEGQRKEWLIR